MSLEFRVVKGHDVTSIYRVRQGVAGIRLRNVEIVELLGVVEGVELGGEVHFSRDLAESAAFPSMNALVDSL